MELLLLCLALFFGGGCVALACGRGVKASRIGAGSAVAASLAGLVPALNLLAQSAPFSRPAPLAITLAKLPMGEFALRLDALSAVFLAPVLILTAVAAVYGMDRGDGGRTASQSASPPDRQPNGHPGGHWFFYNLLAGGMVLALTASDAFLFLLAWEIMSVAPFFLIAMSGNSATSRSASWIYLVAAHLGALFLLAFFALLSAAAGGSLSFAAFAEAVKTLPTGLNGGTGLLFLLALAGFGAKAGIIPLHVWLPESYPAAPSHVSAVMAGAMSNLGIYGLLRALSFLGTGPGSGEVWWAYVLIGTGAATGVLGILQAMAQPTVKRSLAFSSVENMGIILMAVGVALLCARTGHAAPAALALTGALVHMANQALIKGLLFLGAGCVRNGAGGTAMHLLGGLHKRMPVVGWCFMLGSAAMAALPPLNGFAGELYIYCGMIYGGSAFAHGPSPEHSLLLWLCLAALAGIGGLTLLCAVRLYGMTFLGEPRSVQAAEARPPAANETAALLVLAALCVLSALTAPKIAAMCHAAAAPAVHGAAAAPPALSTAPAAGDSILLAPIPPGLSAPRFAPGADSAIGLLQDVNNVFFLFVLAVLAAFTLRRRLLRGRDMGASPTWDCGYVAPTARMQYTAGSFSRPAAWFLRTTLRQRIDRTEITEYFPQRARADMTTPDWIATDGYVPLFHLVGRIADRCKILQHGRSNGYILYVLITLVALLAWKVR